MSSSNPPRIIMRCRGEQLRNDQTEEKSAWKVVSFIGEEETRISKVDVTNILAHEPLPVG